MANPVEPSFKVIEPFVVTSSRKTPEGYWLWTRDSESTAQGLARNVVELFRREGHSGVTVTVVDVTHGVAWRYTS